MDEERAYEIAIRIRDEFEDLLDEKKILIPSADLEGVPGEARLYGEENSRLVEAIVELLIKHAEEITLQGDIDDASHPLRELAILVCDEFEELLDRKGIMVPSADRDGREAEACLYGEAYWRMEDGIVDILMGEFSGGATGEGAASIIGEACAAVATMQKAMAEAPDGFATIGSAKMCAHDAPARSYRTVEVTEMADREHTITLTLCEGDFEMSMGRMPRDDDEFDEWAHLCEKGLLNGHIDWDILYACAKEAMSVDADQSVLDTSPGGRRKPRTKPSEVTP